MAEVLLLMGSDLAFSQPVLPIIWSLFSPAPPSGVRRMELMAASNFQGSQTYATLLLYPGKVGREISYQIIHSCCRFLLDIYVYSGKKIFEMCAVLV
jgi:hypothetical protein